MSKIEDALKKIKSSNSKSLSIVSSNDRVNGIRTTSSVKEIALMKNEHYLTDEELLELKIIHPEMLDSKIADTYRDLRTKIIQKSNGKNISVMVTSCIPGYSSTMTALNLAAAFSFDKSKTSLLIDCNLNEPQLNDILISHDPVGLTDYLENDTLSVDTILQESGIRRLRMILAGNSRETSSEYFTSLKMRDLMSGLISRYSDRYIFLDAPSIVESADTRILVELCDYVLLAVPYGKSIKSRVKEAAESIGSDKLLGVIFVDKPQLPNFNKILKS